MLLYCLSLTSVAQLQVSTNGRHLTYADNTPFFWLGDTGWGLFQKLKHEDVDHYFKTRSSQGFTVIHAAVCHINPFIKPPLINLYGDRPFLNADASKPLITPGNNPADSLEYDYWDHVEFIVDRAREYGLYIVFLPVFGIAEGEGYNFISTDNAYQYGKFIGERFKDKTNIIWCIGGDVLADNDFRKKTWNLLAKGVNEGVAGNEDYNQTLMTFHTRGGHSSSDFFHDAPWLDFHMLQTWASYSRIYQAVSKDYNRVPAKPILHGEGAYEEGPEYPTKPITPYVIRKQMYWAMFAGGMHTYGNTSVWSFGTNPEYVQKDWKMALNSQGVQQLTIARDFFESQKWWNMVPDPSILQQATDSVNYRHVAMKSGDSNKIMVYFSDNKSVQIDGTKLAGDGPIVLVWINPENGRKTEVEKIKQPFGETFTPPTGWLDALLVVSRE